MNKLGDKMEEQPESGSEEKNWEQSRAGRFCMNQEGLHPGIVKEASNTIDDRAEGRRIFPLPIDCPRDNPGPCCKPRKERGADGALSQTTLGDLMDDTEFENMTLRQWLRRPNRVVDRPECLHIFRQILATVDLAHSQGVVLRDIRPSCFILSSCNRVSSTSCTCSGSDSSEHSTQRWSFLVQAMRQNDMCNGNIQDQVLRAGHREDRCSSAQKADHETQESKASTRLGHWLETLPTNAIGRRLESPERFTYSYIPSLDEANSCKLVSSATVGCSSNTISLGRRSDAREEIGNVKLKVKFKKENTQENLVCFPLKQNLLMEPNWYTSPEELVGGSCSFASDIYSLGVLFFELFCSFSSYMEQSRIMPDLRHRVLPPQLLLKWPKEAAFCLWLLHPEPTSRPKLSEILQSEIINESRVDLVEQEAVGKLEEEIADTRLLLNFLIQVQQQKQETAATLYEAVTYLTSDIEVVLKWQSIIKQKGMSSFEFSKEEQSALVKGRKSRDLSPQIEPNSETSLTDRSNLANVLSVHTGKTIMLGKRFRQASQSCNVSDGKKLGKSNMECKGRGKLISRRARLMRNFKELEEVYFSTRSREKQFAIDSLRTCSCNGRVRERPANSLGSIVQQSEGSKADRLGSFFDSLCKHLHFSKFEVKACLKQGDLLNSSNLVCSLGFDCDREHFATAGVSKKIKVFECDTVLNEDVDIHYPVIEMTSTSKLSSICWNSYIKNQIASSAFNGIVELWDVTRFQAVMMFEEHKKRAWSVDFSPADPTLLASGSDDGTVKLWSTNQAGSIGMIKTNANVCCVQFPPVSAHLLAFGSADYKIYCYDLRNLKIPWCILASHSKTVSYVKFLDSSTLISASTDNTLKLWDIATSTGGIRSNSVLTFTGHTNKKNFVGLSVADGYIATGSETNEVFVYHKSLPMPVASYKFKCVNSVTGQEIEDVGGQFVSSTCWRGQSQTLIAANSTGNINILEMV